MTKLGPTSARVYSTYLGGRGGDTGDGVAVDITGNAYVTGATRSSDFPTAGTPSQPVLAGQTRIVFVTKLDPTCGLVYSTFLGGTRDDLGLGIGLDGMGNVHVSGYTLSTDFPVAGASPQPSASGFGDGFVSRLDPTSALVDSTYLGGTDNDVAWGIAVDKHGSAYVTGYTLSEDFPTTCAPSQATNPATMTPS